MGDLGGSRAEGGQSSDNLGDVGDVARVVGRGANGGGENGSSSELHFCGIRGCS